VFDSSLRLITGRVLIFVCFITDVKAWLKSLRLHKYAEIFTTMTYDDMMNLNPDDLDAKVRIKL